MTGLLTKAFQKAAALPEPLQDEIARELLDEIEWEKRWDKTLDKSQDTLNTLAEKALKEYEDEKAEEKGFDQL